MKVIADNVSIALERRRAIAQLVERILEFMACVEVNPVEFLRNILQEDVRVLLDDLHLFGITAPLHSCFYFLPGDERWQRIAVCIW